MEGTDWRKGAKDEWAAKERAVSRKKQIRKMVKDSRSKSGNGGNQKTIVVGKGGAHEDASIQDIERETVAAAGLTEEAEANSGHAAEESASLAGVPPAAAPAEGKDELESLAALLAAQADPAVESADMQQVVQRRMTVMRS